MSAGMMSLPKSCVRRPARVGFERPHQHVGVEDIDAHRGQREIRRSREWRSACFGFSWKPVTRSLSSTATMPKRLASAIGTSIAASVTAAPRLLMEPQHRA